MRSFAVVFFAASLASAATILKRQTTTTLPPCADKCYTSTSSAPCAADDVACQCMNVNFITPLAQCVSTTCSAEEAQTAQAAALETCKGAGIDLTNPVPACAEKCDTSATSTCPTPTDPNAVPDGACYCKDTPFIQNVASCVKSSCTGQDLATAELVAEALCRAYGVDISSVVGA